MVRTLEWSCSSDKADAAVDRFSGQPGVLGISVQRGASVEPPGDVVRLHADRDTVLRLLGELQRDPTLRPGTLFINSPAGVVASGHDGAFERQSVDVSWEESMMLLRRETNPRQGYLALMFLAGVVAAVGLWTDTLHLVVGAMVIAPGFQPLVRLPLGVVAQKRTMAMSGLHSTGAGYLALLAGASAAYFLLDATGDVALQTLQWANYWSSITFTGALLAVAAGAAGALSVAAQRSVLTAGAMIALALVPSAALVAMAASAGDAEMAAAAAARWLVDALGVTAAAFIVLGGKRLLVHKRPAM